MPRIVGVSSWTTSRCIRRSPSAFTVASWRGDSPIRLRVSLMRSFLSATGRLLRSTRAVVAPLARRVQILKSLDLAERVDGRLEHVVRIVGAEGLGEDVLHPRRLQHRTDGAARDDARPWDGRLEEDAARAEVSG